MNGPEWNPARLPAVMEELRRRGEALAEAIGIDLRDTIVAAMAEAPPRTGREYPIPGTGATYTASAPGEHPAEREGAYSASWHAAKPVVEGNMVTGGAYSTARTPDGKHFVGQILEDGTEDGKIAPRRHIAPAVQAVMSRWQETFG
jgi:hypothetical protein